MKLLFDPIYTSDAGHCASNAKMRKIADYLLEKHKDVFIYWLVPTWLNEGDREWYPDHDRIKYVDYPYSKDRMREYMRVDREYERLVAFNGMLWDFDIIITNRTSMTPSIKMLANKPSREGLVWSKRVFLIEDMPLMEFKLHVTLSNNKASSLQTLTGYLCADDIIISAFWEKSIIVKEAKKHLSPSSVNYIQNTMIESSAALVEITQLKTKKAILARYKGERPFTMAFVGRLTRNMKAEEIFDIMGKHWSFRGGDKGISCIATTQSMAAGRVKVPDFIDIQRLSREDFWETIQEKTDVMLFLTNEVDYPMSLIECLLLGCPAIVIRHRWSVPTLGEDYPFFVSGVQEAYGMIKAFYEDYGTLYKKFAEWSRKSFKPLMLSRNKTYPPYIVERAMETHAHDFAAYRAKTDSAANNEITQRLHDYAQKNGGELHLFDAIEALDKQGVLRSLGHKTKEKHADRERRTWGIDWNIFRLGLMMLGYVDASVEIGHLKKPSTKKKVVKKKAAKKKTVKKKLKLRIKK